jgi:prepilin-type processing-associated H-X9-DG protein
MNINFTRKDILIVAGCMVFLMANLGAIGTAGRQKAMESVCMSNLKQWGHMFQMYLADNDNIFMQGKSYLVPDKWFFALAPYYGCIPQKCEDGAMRPREYKLRFCPSAMTFPSNDPTIAQIHHEGALQPFAAWETNCAHDDTQLYSGYYWDGSYGSNSWIYDENNEIAIGRVGNWKNPNVANTDRIPVLADSARFGGRPEASPRRESDEPPQVKNDLIGSASAGRFMKQFCIDRHNGSVNALFMDWSVRPVGLKELWTLTWHRDYNTCNSRTLCGNNGQLAEWPEWMQGFKDY